MKEISNREFNKIRKKLIMKDPEEQFHNATLKIMLLIKKWGFMPKEGITLANLLKKHLKSYIQNIDEKIEKKMKKNKVYIEKLNRKPLLKEKKNEKESNKKRDE